MATAWQHRRATKRVKAGDGRPLRRLRWWQLFSRSLFHLDRSDAAEPSTTTRWSVDVRHGGDASDGEVRARLYRDGIQQAVARLPAAFPVPGGHIEVAASSFGLKRCHFVGDDSSELQLTPDRGSAAGRRAVLARRRPRLSRGIGVVSVIMLIIGVGLNLLQLAEPISAVPPIAAVVGTFTSPVQLPLWLNIALGLGAAAASTERALRLRYSWLLDAMGN